MAQTRVFVSFDTDRDRFLKDVLLAQSKLPDSTFDVRDWSISSTSPKWESETRSKIRANDVVVVICGPHTDTAGTVAAELSLALEEGIAYFHLWGRWEYGAKLPSSAKTGDLIYSWNWDNVLRLMSGNR